MVVKSAAKVITPPTLGRDWNCIVQELLYDVYRPGIRMCSSRDVCHQNISFCSRRNQLCYLGKFGLYRISEPLPRLRMCARPPDVLDLVDGEGCPHRWTMKSRLHRDRRPAGGLGNIERLRTAESAALGKDAESGLRRDFRIGSRMPCQWVSCPGNGLALICGIQPRLSVALNFVRSGLPRKSDRTSDRKNGSQDAVPQGLLRDSIRYNALRCLFRRSCPPIPSEAVHVLRSKPSTCSEPSRPGWSGDPEGVLDTE